MYNTMKHRDPFQHAQPIWEANAHGKPLFPNRPKLSELLLGGPGHDGYTYNAAVYCVDCGQEIIRELYRDGAYNDGDNGDSCQFPQPIFFGESDQAEHCDECQEYMYGPEEVGEDF